MLDSFVRPIRSVLGIAEQEVERPVMGTEHEIGNAIEAIRRATESIDRHVEVIEGLATSIEPLTKSVDQLTSTVAELVGLLAPMEAAEKEVARARRLFGMRQHRPPPDQPAAPPAER